MWHTVCSALLYVLVAGFPLLFMLEDTARVLYRFLTDRYLSALTLLIFHLGYKVSFQNVQHFWWPKTYPFRGTRSLPPASNGLPHIP
jgi:hypothetical protein